MSVVPDQRAAQSAHKGMYIRCTPALVASIAFTLIIAVWFSCDAARGDTSATIWSTAAVGVWLLACGRCMSEMRSDRERRERRAAEREAEDRLRIVKAK